jgi:hypothetical protein
MQPRNLIILVLRQLIFATGSIVFVTLGGVIGTTLVSNRARATLPAPMVFLPSAATTVPAAMLMRRIGCGPGHAVSSLAAAAAMLTAVWASAGSIIFASCLPGWFSESTWPSRDTAVMPPRKASRVGMPLFLVRRSALLGRRGRMMPIH